ncbi:STY4851/ECs_5259 family protein [Haematobacter genomosp. 1]|uniref:Uncharacterized protein n=1 Tax=Haematobacter genomosp. 1 TaxID=366618 RepID=A0A212A9G6_9RHOB|nr:STY4851/ECs_5259 family protein [Haematobacter genomosp. 1]OWJ76648.1 hypothetical protein CDV49_14270 [Haematobacter genomosp. 1]
MNVVQCILARNGLQHPDARPLYAYNITEAEREDLRVFLGPRIGAVAQSISTAQGFALWASEHIRTGFRGGQLTWEFVFEGLSLAYDRPVAIALTSRGLDAWGRALRRSDLGHREFLYSLLAEGGLPDLALANAPRYRGALLGLVAAIEGEGPLGASIADTIALRLVEGLPQVLRTSEQARLMAELALAIVAARNILPADLPVEAAEGWLDAHRPAWRQTLPLRLSPEAFEALVRPALLSERQDQRSDPVLVRRQLRRKADGSWQGVAEIPERARLPNAHLPAVDRNLRLRLTDDAGAGFLAVPVDGGWELVRNAGRDALLLPLAPHEPVFLNAYADGRFLARVLVDAGQPAPDEALSLWRAEASDAVDPDVLVPLSGRGQTRADRVFVLAPAGVTPSTADKLHFSEDAAGPGGVIWAVSGRGTAHFGAHDISIATGAEKDAPGVGLVVLGVPFSGFTVEGGLAAFLGQPVVLGAEGDAPMRPLGKQLRTRSVPGVLGGHVAEWCDAGVVLARTRYVVLPEAMRLELREIADGQLALRASGLPQGLHLHLWAGAQRQAVAVGAEGRAGIQLGAEGQPGTVGLRLTDPIRAESLTMTGLWPSRTARIISAKGERVCANQPLSRRGLVGWRGVVPATGEGAVLMRMARSGTQVAISAAGEVPLAQFGSVLDQALALQGADGKVNLRLVGGGQETPRLEIGRHDWSVEPADALWNLGAGVTRLAAVCLGDPARKATRQAEGLVNPAEWLGEEEGIWFVQGLSETRGVMRPLAWSAQPIARSTRAMRVQTYVEEWQHLLSAPADLGWDRIWSLILAVREGGDASSLDQVQALAEVPAAAAALVLRVGRADRAAALEIETESPIWWPLVPCTAWTEALVSVRDGFRARLRSASIPEAEITALVADRLARTIGEIIALRPELSAHLGQALARAGERPLAVTSTGAIVPLARPSAGRTLAAAAQEALRRALSLPDGVAGVAAVELSVSLPVSEDFRPLLHAPLVAAEVATGLRPKSDAREHLQLIALRAADPIWFDIALPAAVSLALELAR